MPSFGRISIILLRGSDLSGNAADFDADVAIVIAVVRSGRDCSIDERFSADFDAVIFFARLVVADLAVFVVLADFAVLADLADLADLNGDTLAGVLGIASLSSLAFFGDLSSVLRDFGSFFDFCGDVDVVGAGFLYIRFCNCGFLEKETEKLDVSREIE